MDDGLAPERAVRSRDRPPDRREGAAAGRHRARPADRRRPRHVERPLRQGYYDAADWPAIAAAAVTALSDGVDPLDTSAIGRHAGTTLNERDALWLYWLFADPVVVYRDLSGFVNGMHRTWHMRRAGVLRSVVEFE
jgi:hypothetical protein